MKEIRWMKPSGTSSSVVNMKTLMGGNKRQIKLPDTIYY